MSARKDNQNLLENMRRRRESKHAGGSHADHPLARLRCTHCGRTSKTAKAGEVCRCGDGIYVAGAVGIQEGT